jgi:ferredoxin
MKVIADREVCIGAGMCVMTLPAVFDQDDDGLVVLLFEDLEEVDPKEVDPEAVDTAGVEATVRRAVQLCPSGALSLR